jgi:hypothetical protein
MHPAVDVPVIARHHYAHQAQPFRGGVRRLESDEDGMHVGCAEGEGIRVRDDGGMYSIDQQGRRPWGGQIGDMLKEGIALASAPRSRQAKG